MAQHIQAQPSILLNTFPVIFRKASDKRRFFCAVTALLACIFGKELPYNYIYFCVGFGELSRISILLDMFILHKKQTPACFSNVLRDSEQSSLLSKFTLNVRENSNV